MVHEIVLFIHDRTCTADKQQRITVVQLSHLVRGQQFAPSIFASVFFMLAVFVVPAFAADGDPLAVVNNLSDFIFSLIRAVGLILLGFGILQVGLSLKSHDPSQRTNGILTVAGGIVITFTKEILTLITG